MSKPQSDEAAETGTYASPPCYMHELDPAYLGLADDPAQRRDVARWRAAERERLVAARLALDPQERQRWDAAIATRLEAVIGDVAGRIVSLYWPVRGEPDLTGWMASLCAAGACCALPVALSLNAPLRYRQWRPGCLLERDALDIPCPADGPEVVPDLVVAPALAFDRALHRLGYGDGLLDRTLASLPQRPRTVAVAYACAEVATIYPQVTDIPMDAIVTERERIGG